MGKTRKKRIYSKIKTPYIVSEKELTNPIQVVSTMFKVENVWVSFIDKVIYSSQEPSLVSYEDNLFNVISQINDSSKAVYILNQLMKVKDYDPFNDKIPFNCLDKESKKLILDIRIELIRRKTELEKERFNKHIINIDVQNNSYICSIIEDKGFFINKELFKRGIDIVIIYNSRNEYIINSNPDLINRPDFSYLFKRLNQIELDIWYLHGTKGMVKTKRDTTSSLELNEILKIIQNN